MVPEIVEVPGNVDEAVRSRTTKPVEGFIPFRYADLQERLLHDFQSTFADQTTAAQFRTFCDRLSLRNKLRLQAAFKDWYQAYSAVDPDTDRHSSILAHLGRQAAPHSLEGFQRTLEEVLDKGGFQRIHDPDLEEAGRLRQKLGLSARRPDPSKVSYCFWFRGVTFRERVLPGWRSLVRRFFGQSPHTLRIKVYQRLTILFRLLRPTDEESDPEPPSAPKEGSSEDSGINQPLLQDVDAEASLPPPGPVMARDVDTSQWYLRMFKNVEQPDLEMLVPGGSVALSWFDWLYICGPIGFSMCYAIYVAIYHSKFDNTRDILYSIVLVLVPLSYGIQTRFAVSAKQMEYRSHLNELLLLHNLSCNRGVMSHLLDEAGEQEDNEAMLAYIFLWQQPRTQLDLDKAVEAYVGSITDTPCQRSHFDFEVSDATAKLEEMGLLVKPPSQSQAGKDPVLGVLPLPEAVSLLDVANYKTPEREGQAPARSTGMLWRYLYGSK